MVGRDVILKFDKKKANPQKVVLKTRKLKYINSVGNTKVNNISFDLREGEILGVAGVEGNGQGELIEVLTGLITKFSGDVHIYDKNVKKLSIKDIRDLEVAHIPEDRMTYGCAENMDVLHNVFTNQYDNKRYSSKVMLKTKVMASDAIKLVKEFLIKCSSPQQIVGMLSGGNIQKVVVAREFSTNPKIIIANQPTRGIDVGAAEFIRKKIIEFREQGSAVLLISADLNEIMELSDRLVVMYKGQITGVFTDLKKLSEEELGRYMLGLKKDEKLEGITYE